MYHLHCCSISHLFREHEKVAQEIETFLNLRSTGSDAEEDSDESDKHESHSRDKKNK